MIKMKSLIAERHHGTRIELDGLIVIIKNDSSKKTINNIWITDPAAEWQSAWEVWADPDKWVDIRINVTGLAKDPLKMWYTYHHPKEGFKSSSSKIQDKDWNKLKSATLGKKPKEYNEIGFNKASWINPKTGEKEYANYRILLVCKGGWDYRIKK